MCRGRVPARTACGARRSPAAAAEPRSSAEGDEVSLELASPPGWYHFRVAPEPMIVSRWHCPRQAREDTAIAMTVRAAVLDLLRAFGMTSIFGNPGSTELPLFRGVPKDFRSGLGLQEAVVVRMA